MTLYKNAHTPIYKQIKEDIIRSIDEGSYKQGDRLPTERELSSRLQISRGTVKKAYEELEKDGVVEIVWGSGVFVGGRNDEKIVLGTEETWVPALVDGLYEIGCSAEEAEAFIQVHLMNKLQPNRVNIAAVDCNVETLEVLKSQLSHIKETNCVTFLLNDLKRFKHRELIFNAFDLVFTTTTHYDELSALLPVQQDKIIRAVVAPDKNTLINLFKLPAGETTGMLVKSSRFRDIVKRNIEPYGLTVFDEDCIFDEGLGVTDFDRFLQNKGALILPPLYTLRLKAAVYDRIFAFAGSGGRMITFNYAFEKGSLIYIEEKIADILHKE